jgi:hypothetical protein
VNRAVHAAPAEQARVRGVDDGVDVLVGDVAEDDGESGGELKRRRCVRFP